MPPIPERLKEALAGRYAIERELGAGGMATVYLAHDVKHDRKVALKVLKPELAAVLGAERFVVEIRTTASLQHPHILPLFDSGTADGFLYYVMPFIEGETLRDKLNRETQLGVDEAVALTRDVADALDYAHRHGVIHRDIKPENILLHDGRPMVADFGIALAVSAAAGGRMTETGLSLGTPHYMSPEQATADKEITGRSDVYSLASVLYEMLAGQPPHLGGSAQQIIMKIIAEPVEFVTRYRKSVPPNVAAALAKALEKLPADRFDSAKAFRDALSDKGFVTQTAAAAIATAPATRWKALALASAALALLSMAALVASRSSPGVSESRVARYNLASPGADTGDGVAGIRHVAISADGSQLAWITRSGNIWTRRRDALEAQKVEIGESGALTVALSPDGRELAFTRLATLFVMSLAGGGIHERAESVNGFLGVDWGDDGYLYFSRRFRVNRVPAAGGVAEIVIQEDTSGIAPRRDAVPSGADAFPKALPGGRGILFVRTKAQDSLEFRVWNARTKRSHVIAQLSGGESRASVPVGYHDGYVLSVTIDRTLWATSFDLRRLEALSEPQPLQKDVLIARSVPAVDISATGDLIMAAGAPLEIHLARVTLDGRVTPLPVAASDFRGVRLSPDGRRVAYGANQTTFVHDLSIGSTRQLLEWSSYDPVWSRDGARITVHSNRPGEDTAQSTLGFDGFEIAADGSGTQRRLFRHPQAEGPQAWTPDGKLIAHGGHSGGTGHDLFVVSFDGDSARVETLLDAPWTETMPSLSRDGKWIAYRANPTGTLAVFVRRFPDAAAGVWQVSQGAGTEPVWSPDGRSLYYWDGSVLIAARLRTSPEFAVVSRDTVLRDIGYVPPTCCHSNYDVLNDGSGFIMALHRDRRQSDDRLILVEGLLAELKKNQATRR